MILNELTATPGAALPIAAFSDHLHLGKGFADDGAQDQVLDTYLRSALAAVEARTGKVLFARQFSWQIHGWHGADRQGLPVAPVSSIDNVTLVDGAGTPTTVDPAAYRLKQDTHRPVLAARGATLPTITTGGSATITFTAGFGPTWDDVPHDLRQAVFLLAANYFDNRHGHAGRGEQIPFGVMALLEPHRPIRLGGGGGL